eukprot:1579106-Lingulodinium_polyedra.AAC.1
MEIDNGPRAERSSLPPAPAQASADAPTLRVDAGGSPASSQEGGAGPRRSANGGQSDIRRWCGGVA